MSGSGLEEARVRRGSIAQIIVGAVVLCCGVSLLFVGDDSRTSLIVYGLMILSAAGQVAIGVVALRRLGAKRRT